MRAALHLRQAWHRRWLFPLTVSTQVLSRRGGLLQVSAQLSTGYRHRALPAFRDAQREIIRKYHQEYPSLTLTRRAVKECFGSEKNTCNGWT